MPCRSSGARAAATSSTSPRPRGSGRGPGLTWYNGSKGAVIIMTKSMAVELAPDKIRVNAICPVIGETGLTAELHGRRHAGAARQVRRHDPARPDEPARGHRGGAVFLASDEAEFLTGLALEVDGGRCV